MKILQVASSLNEWGGIERYVAYLSGGLQLRGHEVAVTHGRNAPLGRYAPVEKIELSSRGKFDWAAFRSYYRLFRSRPFDVIHLHFGPDILVAALSAKLSRTGVVLFTRHVAIPWNRMKSAGYLRCIDHVLPVSPAVEEVLLRDGIPANRIWLAESGCPEPHPRISREAARKELDLNGFSVGVFGRLVQEKGVRIAIEAAASARVSLEVFGDGHCRQELEDLARQLNAPARFHGFREDVIDAMNAVDVVVVPSLWADACPFAALEAMALGKPIVASAVGGLPMLIVNDKTGILVERGNSSELAKGLERLKQSGALRTRLGCAAQEVQRERYTVELMTERVERVYREVCEAAGSGGLR